MYGQYHVIERIAVGGMAEIYLGVAQGVEGFERPVVIKKVRRRFSRDSRFHAMLVKEAKITGSLNHPNIVQILDLGQNEREEYFIVMEYVEGKDLRTVMDRTEEREIRLDWDVVLYIAVEICAALEYAHKKVDEDGRPLHLIHRDVSPSNILISQAGEVKLTDFGIARYGRDVSVVGSLKGKLGYMSPEQARTELLDHRSDIFSLGAVMFEILLGRRVFNGDTDLELLDQVREGRVPRPTAIDSSMPEQLEQILLRALAPDPELRYQSAEEMGAAIRGFQFQFSSVRVGPDNLARLLRRLFPEEPQPSQPRKQPSFQFTISTLVEMQDPSGEVERPGDEQVSFVDVVTSVGQPSPELLARTREPVDPISTLEQPGPPSFIEDPVEDPFDSSSTDPSIDLLRVVGEMTGKSPAARPKFAPLKPAVGRHLAARRAAAARDVPSGGEPRSQFDDVETEVASPSGIRSARRSGVSLQRESSNTTARAASLASSLELSLADVRDDHPTEPQPVVHRDDDSRPTAPQRSIARDELEVEDAAPPTNPPEVVNQPEPVAAPTGPTSIEELMASELEHHASEPEAPLVEVEDPTRLILTEGPLPAGAFEPTRILQAESAVESAPPTASEPTRVLPHDESPFARVAAPLDPAPVSPEPRRRWVSWLVVAIFGLTIGGSAALLLLLPGSPLRLTRKGTTVADGGTIAEGATTDGAPADARLARRLADGRPVAVEKPLVSLDAKVRPDIERRVRIVRTNRGTRVRRRNDAAPIRPRIPPTPRKKATGRVVIKSEPWAYIYVDGRNTKLTTSAQPFTLAAGRRRVELVNPALNLRKKLVIEVEPDGLVRRFVRLEE